ncbi:MAG: D-alanine--D-alanine ligase [Verrucomicrobiales bacterium]|nr:D-alanine--D-alanine ligase [Verrucomicrobiales bacterium]
MTNSKDVSELNVAVLAGGPGSERKVSLASGKGVAGALEGAVAKVELVDVPGPGFDLAPDVDICFNVVHGTFGEDGGLQAELTKRGIAYTGAREVSSRLAFDKVLSKEQFLAKGICTPASAVVMVDDAKESPVGLPCVVKPPREGSSVGVHLVHTQEEWDTAVADAGQYSPDILVEELIVGKELTVGVVGAEALPIIHIQPRSGFYDIKNKYPWMTGDGGTDYFCPADLSEAITEKVQSESLKAHQSLGIEVYSRVDVLLGEGNNNPYVLEVNTLPGMTESSLLPKAAAACGMDYSQLCLKIIELSLKEG